MTRRGAKGGGFSGDSVTPAAGPRGYNAAMPHAVSLADHFLIAMPSLADPHFVRGVTLICQHDESGAMGLVVNHRSEYNLDEVLRQMEIATDSMTLGRQPVLVGGPVQPDRGFVLHDDPRDFGSTLRFGAGLAVSTSREILQEMARGEGPQRTLVTLGYAGWTAGQLEAELSQNAWLTVPADKSICFECPLEQRWEAAARAIGVDISRMSAHLGHA
jgi:putative transcriptional regulator